MIIIISKQSFHIKIYKMHIVVWLPIHPQPSRLELSPSAISNPVFYNIIDWTILPKKMLYCKFKIKTISSSLTENLEKIAQLSAINTKCSFTKYLIVNSSPIALKICNWQEIWNWMFKELVLILYLPILCHFKLNI